jgi:hypothetical protein
VKTQLSGSAEVGVKIEIVRTEDWRAALAVEAE